MNNESEVKVNGSGVSARECADLSRQRLQWGQWQGPLDDGVPVLINLFDALFGARYKTVLVAGAGEPQYVPDHDGGWHRIEFAHGYFASALHEVAHWCIAGAQRRQWLDFGYWYCPDGRSAPQQRAFEQVEVKPQALEWIFSVASGRRFRVSADNLAGDPGDIQGFERAVHQEVLRRLDVGLPQRAAQFTQALLAQFAPGLVLGAALFDRDALR